MHSKNAMSRIRQLEMDSKIKSANDEKIEISSYLKTHVSQRRLFWTMKISTGELVYKDIQSIKSFVVDEHFGSIADPLDRAIVFGIEFKNVHLYQLSGLEGASMIMQSPVQEKYSDSTASLHDYQLAEKTPGPIVEQINPVHYFNTLLSRGKGKKPMPYEPIIQLKAKQKKRKRKGKKDSKSTGVLSSKVRSSTKEKSSSSNSFHDLLKLFRVSANRPARSPKLESSSWRGRARSPSVSHSRTSSAKTAALRPAGKCIKQQTASKRTRSIERSRLDSLGETRLTHPEGLDVGRSSGIWSLLKESDMKRVSF